MFIRYRTDGRGKSLPVATIYTSKEHEIRNSRIDRDALWAIRKLQASGAEAYIVGGSIRDLMLGRKPKDFDIATSASPRQVQRLFWNARIIGRRFRIVHLFFNEKIIEVTTFRSDEENFEEGNNNVFGTIEQDAKRRDFSINSLYYNPANGQLLDFNGAMHDFRKKVIRSLIPLSYSFSEDPVRMIRAIKYKVTTGFRLKWDVRRAIKRNADRIGSCSTSRLTEEIEKIMASGCCLEILQLMHKYGLLGYMMPCFSVYLSFPAVIESIKALDSFVNEAHEKDEAIDRSRLLYFMIRSIIFLEDADPDSPDEAFKEAFRQSKVLISPLTPPNYEIEKAVELALKDMGMNRKPRKAKQGRKKPGDAKRSAAKVELPRKKKA